jgi:hypothetical protein
MHKDNQRLVRELPQKRRPTEVAASHNWQPGAVGRHNTTSIRDAFGAHAIGTRVRLLLAWRVRFMESETRREVAGAVQRIVNDKNAIG